MSQVLSSQLSLEAPSRYTLFERDVFGASSPQREKLPKTSAKKLGKDQKLKRFSEVAFAGESPNLQDVSSGLSKSKKSVLVVSENSRSVQIVEPSTSRQNYETQSPILFDSRTGSSTPSIRVESRNASHFRPSKTVSNRPTSSPPQATHSPSGDLLLTESYIESSAVINGQPNVLRIESSPDAALPNSVRLSRNQQLEFSVERAKAWLNSLPENSDPAPYPTHHDNSLASSVSKRSEAPGDSTQGSVMVVAPDPNVREVRILLQRLDPQVLLRIPIRDIQNLMNSPSNLSMPYVQKTMTNLLSSNKLGVTPVDKQVMKSIQSNNVLIKSGGMSKSRSRSSSMEKKTKGKRKLYTVQRQMSNMSQELSVSTSNMNVQCPYTPPTKKKVRTIKKPRALVHKKLLPDLGQKKTKGKKRSPPKPIKPSKKKSPAPNDVAIVTRTRSSEALTMQTTAQPASSKGNPESIASSSNVPRKSHEMTLRKKSNPRRTSLFFQPKSQVTKPKKVTKRDSSSTKQGPRVVCTFLHRNEVDRVAGVIKKLGGTVENKVTALTTHVVCGGPKRTINLLRGIARGCWLVTYEWVLQSMEKRKWVEEEPFEVTNFSPAVQKCRIARETLGIFPVIFEKVGTIFVAPKTAPPKSELSELLKLCGAKLVSTTRRATVAVGAKIPGIQSVSEVWVLDSIQENVLLPPQRYLLS